MSQVQKEARLVGSTVQILSLLVQLPNLWAQGSINQHVHLSALRYQPGLAQGVD